MKILSRWTNSIIFEDEKKTIRETILNAVKRGINLSDADLRGANLSYANLSYADLRDADLSCASLRGANLSYADLSYADLRGANLRDASLRGANLSYAVGNKKEVRTMQVDTYSISFTVDMLQIGCKRFSIEQWKEFDDKTIEKMDKGALEWWLKWKEFIFKAIELSFEMK